MCIRHGWTVPHMLLYRVVAYKLWSWSFACFGIIWATAYFVTELWLVGWALPTNALMGEFAKQFLTHNVVSLEGEKCALTLKDKNKNWLSWSSYCWRPFMNGLWLPVTSLMWIVSIYISFVQVYFGYATFELLPQQQFDMFAPPWTWFKKLVLGWFLRYVMFSSPYCICMWS